MSKLSCISILEEENVSSSPLPPSIVIIVEDIAQGQNPFGIEVLKICLIGTHKPSIMLMSIIHGRNFTLVMSYMGTTHSGCVPNNVNDALQLLKDSNVNLKQKTTEKGGVRARSLAHNTLRGRGAC
jgi:hypothetical protein